MIKNSVDPKVQELGKQIDALKKQRAALMGRMRESQYRLNYKKAEQEAIAKLIEMEEKKSKSLGRDEMAKLKRMRHSMEFKISTEPLSLAQERSIARRISEVNAQIEDGMKTEKLERKRGLVSKDIEAYQNSLNDVIKSVMELDAKLDELYSSIRKALGIRRRFGASPKQAGAPQPRPKRQEINLEDIVIIKKKDAKPAQQKPAE